MRSHPPDLRVHAATATRPSTSRAPRRFLGRGRSGVVYLERQGRTDVAVKVFTGDTLGDIVHLVTSGAPNPYGWCGEAVQCAFYRRRIVAELVRYWFGDSLRVAGPLGVAWNAEHRAWEMGAEFVRGRPAALHHPFSARSDREQSALWQEVMRPLQANLAEAGLDGLLWQAGAGNPVAANNFLLEHDEEGRPGATWAWIDMESGVPALFPLNPFALLKVYLPLSWAHGRPLFDDVDVKHLGSYLRDREHDIDSHLGPGTCARLHADLDLLATAQADWRSRTRLQAGVAAALAVGRLDSRAASVYLNRPSLWYRDEALRMWGRLFRAAANVVRRQWSRLRAIRPRRVAALVWRVASSQRYRERLSRTWALTRVRYWVRRHQLGPAEARQLRALARCEEHGAYFTDFGTHLALKPAYKALTFVGVPLLVQAGWFPLWLAGALVVTAGSITRTIYTGGRTLQALVRRHAAPWTALAVGVLPVVGVLAYPAQILASSRRHTGKLAGLILYDTLTRLGRAVPVWGGEDSGVEQFFNRLADLVVTDREPLEAAEQRPGDAERVAA